MPKQRDKTAVVIRVGFRRFHGSCDGGMALRFGPGTVVGYR
jgi:hypothetical protein